jgi:acyl carrier protein
MYDAYSRNSSPDLKPLTFQYRDFAAWQNRLLSGKELQEYDSYWMGQFSGPLPILNLPFDKPRPALKTFNGNILHTRLPPELTDKLKKLSGDQQATVFMTILASVNILFHKFSGQEDIIIGIPAAGREHADLDNQVGLYVNTLAIRTHLNDTDTFLRVLSKIKKSTLDAQRYQAYPFDLLVDHLKLDRDLSRSTLFDVMVVFHDTKQRDQELATPPLKDIEANKYDTKKGSTKFDFTLHFSETEEDIGLELDYNTDLFSDGRIREIMDYYLALLSSIVSVPNSTIGLLDYIPEKYKERLNNKAIGIIDGYYSGISRVLDKYVEKGRLITGATAKILDSSGGWIPEGMRGEIYIDYKGALTGTGTIGMTQGKSIRYLGRKESERDWKGQKINLDQLDHYLKRFPGVIDAASAIVPGTSGTDSLLACIGSDEDIDPTEMSGFLELHLSYFLPPDKLVFQEPGNLPVTVEDWQHICQVAEEQEEENKEFEAPRTAIEMKLSDITSRICDGQSISIRENFFTAGFNSLKAMRLMVAINKELGIKLNLTQIFSHPTLESLAKSIDPVALEELSSDLSSKMAI